MYTSSLPLNPPSERIQQDAQEIANGIQMHLTYIEREPIAVYGRCLILNQVPTNGQELRFIHALRKFAPYCVVAGRLSASQSALREFQDEIARRVAEGVRS